MANNFYIPGPMRGTLTEAEFVKNLELKKGAG